MAADLDLEKERASHEKGYSLFIALMKWGAILSFITAMIVVFIIA
ncbi:MAG: aa3-type cytochrome c oxidase subunit IV [Allosphingosinicella sp.]